MKREIDKGMVLENNNGFKHSYKTEKRDIKLINELN